MKILLYLALIVGAVSSWPDFYFYPRSSSMPVKLSTQGSLNWTTFDYSKSTTFVVHGFTSSYLAPNIRAMGIALFNRTDANIIMVDWQDGSGGTIDYPAAFENMHVVGNNISIFIKFNKINPANILCVGHSLGAHACGFAGKNLVNLKRIIGLDPAGPLFDIHSPDKRLNSTDAKLVDVIHTTKITGIIYSIGHKDFWPNHGIVQPGCDPLDIDCSHERAVHLFIESTESPKKFISAQCTDGSHEGERTKTSDKYFSQMGFFADLNNLRGSFFIKTHAKYPFSPT